MPSNLRIFIIDPEALDQRKRKRRALAELGHPDSAAERASRLSAGLWLKLGDGV